MRKTHIFATNAAVDSHNNAVFLNSSSSKANIKAVDIIVGNISDELILKKK